MTTQTATEMFWDESPRNPAVLAVSDGATYNFGSQVIASTTDKTFTVTNSGEVSASGLSGSGLSSPYTFKGGVILVLEEHVVQVSLLGPARLSLAIIHQLQPPTTIQQDSIIMMAFPPGIQSAI